MKFRLLYASLNILAYALVFPKTGEGIDARAFAAKTAARLRTFLKFTVGGLLLTTSAEVSQFEVGKQITNG